MVCLSVCWQGTPFMARLSVCLEYFIHDRMNNNPAWRGIKVCVLCVRECVLSVCVCMCVQIVLSCTLVPSGVLLGDLV